MRTKTFLVTLAALALLCMPEISFAQNSNPKEENDDEVKRKKPEAEFVLQSGESFIPSDGFYLILEKDFEGHIVCDHSGYYPAGTPVQFFCTLGPENARLLIKRIDIPIPTPMNTIIIPAG